MEKETLEQIRGLRRTGKLMFSIVFVLALMIVFIFAKVENREYRPIIITTRTVVAGTSYQPSITRKTIVNVSAQLSCTSLLIAGASGSISLQVSQDNITYTTVSVITNSISGVLSLTNVNGSPLQATVDAGYYYKIVNTTTTGTPVFSITTPAQETQL